MLHSLYIRASPRRQFWFCLTHGSQAYIPILCSANFLSSSMSLVISTSLLSVDNIGQFSGLLFKESFRQSNFSSLLHISFSPYYCMSEVLIISPFSSYQYRHRRFIVIALAASGLSSSTFTALSNASLTKASSNISLTDAAILLYHHFSRYSRNFSILDSLT